MASYYKSGVLFLGTLAFGISQILRFIQLFRDAAARKAANQAPPEHYTTSGIVFFAAVMLVILVVCFLLFRCRKGRLRIPRSMMFFIVSVLLVLFGAYHLISWIVEMFRNAELTLLFDIAGVATSVLVPVIVMTLADIKEEPADDMPLLISGIGGVLLSAVALLILILLRESYANSQLLFATEIILRIGMVLFGLAALQKALRLRRSYPIVTEEAPASKHSAAQPKPKPRAPREDAPLTLHLDGEIEETYAPTRQRASRPQANTLSDTARIQAQAARRTLERERESLRAYAQTDFDDAPPKPRASAPSASSSWQPSANTGRIIIQGGTGRISTTDPGYAPNERQTCPSCGKRMPLGFPTCPRCGRSM